MVLVGVVGVGSLEEVNNEDRGVFVLNGERCGASTLGVSVLK